jgi:hypothetical protein
MVSSTEKTGGNDTSRQRVVHLRRITSLATEKSSLWTAIGCSRYTGDVNVGREITPEYLQRRRLTARNLADFRLCPQKYLLSLAVSPEQTRKFIGGPAAVQWATRAALVECYDRGGPQQVPVEDLLQMFEDNWDGNLCADSLEETQLHSRAVQMLAAYYETHHDKPNRALASGLRLTGNVEGHDFVAVADRVDEDETGLITLLRYKSGSSPPGPGSLAGDISAGLLLVLGTAHYAPQPCRTAVYALQPGRLIVADTDDDRLTGLRSQIARLAHRVHTVDDFPTNTGTHCRWCRSRADCPAWADAHYRRGGDQ